MNRSIDGLRAAAIIVVMLFHVGAPLAGAGWIGVDLFFVLSGFLITTLLLDEKKKTGSVSLRMFWARRFLRLMPIYVLYVAAMSLAMLLGPAEEIETHAGWTPTEYVLSLWTYVGNLPPQGGIWRYQQLTRHLWSLSLEEQFYLVWPVLFVRLLRTRWPEPVAWGIVLATMANNLLAAEPPTLLLHTRGIGLFIGCAIAISLSKHRDALTRARWISAKAASVACGAVVVCFGVLTFCAYRYGFEEPQLIRLGIPLFSLCAGLLVANLWTQSDSKVARWLSVWPLPQIGAISYGAYLYHMLVAQLVWVGLLDGIEDWPKVAKFGLRLSLYFVLTLAAAQLSYRHIEAPFLRWKARFRPNGSHGAGWPHPTAAAAARSGAE